MASFHGLAPPMTLEALSVRSRRPRATASDRPRGVDGTDNMRLSIRTTMLAIVLPLAVVTLSISAARIGDLVAMRHDVAGFRDSVFRSIYAERYARHLHALLKASFDGLAGRGEGVEAVASARARMVDTLERLRPFVTRDDTTVSELTVVVPAPSPNTSIRFGC